MKTTYYVVTGARAYNHVEAWDTADLYENALAAVRRAHNDTTPVKQVFAWDDSTGQWVDVFTQRPMREKSQIIYISVDQHRGSAMPGYGFPKTKEVNVCFQRVNNGRRAVRIFTYYPAWAKSLRGYPGISKASLGRAQRALEVLQKRAEETDHAIFN